MTVNALAIALLQEMGESSDDAGFVAVVEGHINDALRDIAIATNFNTFKTRSKFTTEIGEAQYRLPSGAREIIQLRYTDTGEPITLAETQELARRGFNFEESDRPRFWLEDGTVLDGSAVLLQIRLVPVPNSELEIEVEYYFNPAEVASSSHLPIQDNLIGLVKDHVRAAMLEKVQKYDGADRATRRYQTNLRRVVLEEQRKVARHSRLQQTDLVGIRTRRTPILDPNHFNNGNLW